MAFPKNPHTVTSAHHFLSVLVENRIAWTNAADIDLPLRVTTRSIPLLSCPAP
jgi:hypothetical protein